MKLVPQPPSIYQQPLTLAAEQIQHRRLVIGVHNGQRRGFLADEQSHGAGIPTVRLIRFLAASSPERGPTAVDLVDRLAGGDKMLREPTPVAPGAFDAPPTRGSKFIRPRREAKPTALAVGPAPLPELSSGIIDGDGRVHLLVRINSDANHRAS